MQIPRRLLFGAVLAASLAIVPATASAAHCVSPDGTSPGFSYFGRDHVKESAHANEGGNPGPHAGTPGASNCLATSGNPSGRAPGN